MEVVTIGLDISKHVPSCRRASGKIIVDSCVRAAARVVLLGCASILARLSIMPQVVPKQYATRANMIKCEIMPRVFNSQAWGLEIMMEESSWIEPNSSK
jgi:hypothetical protein